MKKITVESEKFTREKQRQYRKVINPITSELQAALIMHRLKTGHKGQADTAQLAFDENRQITEREGSGSPKKGAIDIVGNIESLNILDIRKNAYNQIDLNSSITPEDKERIKEGINDFIVREFINTRANLEHKKHLPNKKFRQYYTLLALSQSDLSQKEKILYRDICLTFANLLYEKNHNYINKEGQITQDGLDYISRVFLKTIKNIPNSGSSKSFHKIFHDGDFNFLRKENSEGEPRTGTLDLYIKAIMYLMDAESFNAYAEGGKEGAEERYKSKKSFLNNLYATMYLKDENIKGMLSDKGILHKKFSQQRLECKDSITNPQNRDLSSRLKTDASKILKIGSRTTEIKDESGVRATYYGDIDDKKEITNAIITMCNNYLSRICNIDGVTIKRIETDIKGDFISEDDEALIQNQILECLSEHGHTETSVHTRNKPSQKKSKLNSISTIYQELTGKWPREGLQEAYRISEGNIKRGSNGKYSDFKLIVEYNIDNEVYNERLNDNENHIEAKTDLYQEISFYTHENDFNMGNHNFLDLEKRIFARVKSMNDSTLGKSISLNRLRYFTESTIKDISFDIEVYQDKIKRGILPQPQSDDYKYLNIEGEKISLEGLTYRTKSNTDRFDKLIPIILNYFIKKNKIFYINKKDEQFFGLINSEQLHDKHGYKIRRFTTSDVLRNIALDTKNEDHTISIYTDEKKEFGVQNFNMVKLGDLGDFISLEKSIKK